MSSPRPIFLLAFCVLAQAALWPSAAGAQTDTYVEAVAQDGEGLYALLRRYGLPIDNCHAGALRRLNGLTPEQYLRKGRTYKLPIYRYAYDGKSIRTTIGNPDLDVARAIQRYNRAREKDGLQDQRYEKSNDLWVPAGQIDCAEAREPQGELAASARDDSSRRGAGAGTDDLAAEATYRTRGYDIFGEDHREVERVSQDLRGHYFYLIAGHGGPDPGAMATVEGNRVCEDEYAYDVVLRIARHILRQGGTPYVIVRDGDDGIRDEKYLPCDYDEVVWGDLEVPRGQVARLTQRTETVNELAREAKSPKGQWCIEVHVDSRHAERQTDLFFYHQRGSDLSEDMAEEMRDALKRNYKRQRRKIDYRGTILTRDLHTLRETEVPTVYIELGNIQHSFDQKRVLLHRNREALARWLVEGIVTGVTEGLE